MRMPLLAASVGLAGVLAGGAAYAGPGGDPPCAFQRDGCAPNHVYVVQRGDWLWKIAREHLSSHGVRHDHDARIVKRHADQIYRANRSTIGGDPSRISPGMRLRMPNP